MPKSKPDNSVLDFIKCKDSDPAAFIANAAQQKFIQIEGKHHEALYKLLAICLILRNRFEDFDAYTELKNEPCFKTMLERYQPGDETGTEQKTTLTAYYLFAGPSLERRDRAWKYGRLVHYHFVNKTDPDTLAHSIKEDGGLEKALKAVTALDPRRARRDEHKPGSAAKDSASDLDDLLQDNDGGTDERGEIRANEHKTVRKNEKKKCSLDVEMNKKQLAKAFSCRIGSRVLVHAERLEDKGDWKVFKAKRVVFK